MDHDRLFEAGSRGRQGVPLPIATLGHGTLTADGFAAVALGAGVDVIVDVRRYPGSRRHPHFGGEAMAAWLPAHGLAYRALPALGGRRSPRADSANVALRNPQFRGYADHMASGEFAKGIAELLATAGLGRVALMCAESVFWRCHRRLTADHLVLVEDLAVEHRFHDGRAAPHTPTPGARRAGSHVVYDADPRPVRRALRSVG